MGVDEAVWDNLLAHIHGHVLVPVVGPDIPIATTGTTQQTLTGLIGQHLIDKYELAIPAGEITMGHAVAEFIRERGRNDVFELYEEINDIFAKIDAKPGDALRNLAAISDLHWFVSTTPDRLLATALNEVRFGGQAKTRQVDFWPQMSTSEVERNNIRSDPEDTVVLSLFGHFSTLQTTFPIHEEDELEWLHALLTEKTTALPDWLESELRNNPLLFIGCEIHDWLGRFLMRMESSNRIFYERKQFFFVSSPSSSEATLSEFFSTYFHKNQVRQISMEPADFIAELRARWEKDQSGRIIVDPVVPRGTIFISYMHEDLDAARQLADAIKNKPMYGDVWFDEQSLYPGDAFDRRITAAIGSEVQLFIPVISANTERARPGYVYREWNAAIERSKEMPPSRRFIIPVLIDPISQADPDSYKELPDEFRKFHFGRAPAGKPDEDLITTLTREIQAMRDSSQA